MTNRKKGQPIAWHQLQAEEVVQLLEANPETGLSSSEVKHRQAKFGPNEFARAPGTHPFFRFLLQFHQPLVYILLAATAMTLYLQEWVDGAVIFAVVLINSIIGFLQETKAEKAINALAKMVVTEAMVRRDGRKIRVPSVQLVPGDVVLLQSGDRVPADLRLYQVRNLQADESALTGESVPVEKHPDALALDTILAERKNLAFAGTMVTSGQGEGLVWAIGDKTEAGRIAWLLSEAVDLRTPLTLKIAHFSKILLGVILTVALGTLLIGIWRGLELVQVFTSAVALAVAAIPEGLPAAVTITLAIGVSRMAKRRAIIRKLPAVETLGSTTVICSDKTGTLTENQMTVQEIFAGNKLYQVSGGGFDAAGRILFEGEPVSPASNAALAECLKAGLLCNDSELVLQEGRLLVQGDPTEAALIISARKAGFTDLHEDWPRLDVIPFESEHQFMATLHHRGPGEPRLIYKKGAVERLLDRCTVALDENGAFIPLNKELFRHQTERMASQGLRVLGFACRVAPDNLEDLEHHHVADELTFLGLQGMIDPPRAEAITAVHRCQTAGIQVKMITGDHLLTAAAIARQIGLHGAGPDPLPAISGRQLEQCSDLELGELAESTAVFARVAPEQKLRLVKGLQSRGHIVAMTGDGVNDAPALKQANIGIAMGRSGTDVAKGAADMLLTDDNFASIEAAVEEGRGVFDNLTKFIIWTIPTNAGQGLLLFTSILFGFALPALPAQLLWVNMSTAILLGLTLVFEPKEADLMLRPPRDPKLPILSLPLIFRTALVTLLMLAGALGLFFWEQINRGAEIAEARTIVINVVVMAQLFYLLNCRCLVRSMWSVGVFSNRWLIAGIFAMISAQMLFTYAPFMNRLFHTAPIPAEMWLKIVAVGITVYTAVGFEKWIRSRLGKTIPGQATSEPLTH